VAFAVAAQEEDQKADSKRKTWQKRQTTAKSERAEWLVGDEDAADDEDRAANVGADALDQT